MSLFGKKEEPVVAPVVEETVKPEPVSTTTRIGNTVKFVGDIVTDEELIIDGTVQGNITSSTTVTVSATGVYEGDAEVKDINISGRVNGTIKCDNAACISETGRLEGELKTSKLITVEGSVFDGRLHLAPKHSDDVPATAENIFE